MYLVTKLKLKSSFVQRFFLKKDRVNLFKSICLGTIFFILFFTRLPAENLEKEPLFVSLGSHCEVAIKLRENQLRTTAFPFDWLLTLDHRGLIALLQDNFTYFLNEQYFIKHPYKPYVLENCYYKIEFRHDQPSLEIDRRVDAYQKQMQEIAVKYARRIDRFRQLGACTGKVFFIRAAYDFQNDPNPYFKEKSQAQVTLNQAVELKNALEQFFPFLDFTLIIINYKEEKAPSITGVDRVMEFKIRKEHKNIDYLTMFKKILLSLKNS